MADRTKHVGVTPVNNPLLSAAGSLFPYENFASAAQLVPITQRGPSISLSEDVGEVDSFLGQDALPSIPLPGVLTPELRKPSAEQLQPITFYNAQGQPTGGAGLDFLGPVGVSHKSSESAFLTRHKQFAARRRPVVQPAATSSPASPLPPVSVTTPSSLKPVQLVAATSEPASIDSVSSNPPLHFSKVSPLLQEPTLPSKTLLLPPKSQSTPPSPSIQLPLPTSSSQPHPAVSKSQPTTASPSPSHKSQASPLVSQVLSPPPEESSVSKTGPSIAQDKKASASPSTYSFVQSFVSELFSVTEKSEKSSPQAQFHPTPVSESVSLGSGTSVQSSEETSIHSTLPTSLLSQSQDLHIPSQTSSLQATWTGTSLTRLESPSTDSESQSSKALSALYSESEESHQTSQNHYPATVSLISPSTAEALLSLGVGKRLSCSEVKPEDLPSELLSATDIRDSDTASLHSNSQEDKSTSVCDSERFKNQGFDYSNREHISSEKEVGDRVDKRESEKSFVLPDQDIALGQSYFSPSDKETVSRGVKATSARSHENQSEEATKVEHIPNYQSPTENVSPVSEPQLIDLISDKVIEPETDSIRGTAQVSDQDRASEYLAKDFVDRREPPDHLSSPDKTSDTSESLVAVTSATKENNLSPYTHSFESSNQSEARLPNTSEPNSSNPPTPRHSLSTHPNQFSSYLGAQSVPSNQKQYFTPTEQPSQRLTVHPEKPSPGQFFTPSTEPNQTYTPAPQNQTPLYFTPAQQPSQPPLQEHGLPFPSKAPYQSQSESSQLPSSLQATPQLAEHSTQSQTPLFYTPTLPIGYPHALQSVPPPPLSQVFIPAATTQTPISHFTTSASTRQFPGQHFTPKSSHFHSPIPPPPSLGGQLPGSQTSQEFTSPYLIPTTQVTHPPVHIFTPTAPAGQFSVDQPLTPSLKTAQPPSRTPPNGLYNPNSSQFSNLPPRPPSNPSLPHAPLTTSIPPLQPPPPPGQSLPHPPPAQRPFPHASLTLTPSATGPQPPPPSQYPHAPPTSTLSASGLPPPPKSNSVCSPHVNQYSIHAKPQHSRRSYIAPSVPSQGDYFNPSPLHPLPVAQPITPPVFHQASPVTFLVPDQSVPSSVPPPSTAAVLSNNQENQPVTYFVPNRSSSSSPLSSVPLTPATTPPAPCNGVVSPSSVTSSQFPVQSCSQPVVPPPSLTPSFPPPPTKQGGYNPFSARATPPPSSSLPQKIPVEPVPLPPPPSAYFQPQPVSFSPPESIESVPLSGPPLSSTSGNQRTPSASPPDLTLSINSVNFVPSNPTAPPSVIPEGGPKTYRLGKQRPRYAQVPDLAISPSAVSPVYPPTSSKSVYGAAPPAAEPYPIYPPGSQQLIASEDYLVPADNSIPDLPEGIPSSLFNLATQPGSATAAASGGSNSYRPVYCHWFFKKEEEPKPLWKPFSFIDSAALESTFSAGETNEGTLVPTDGGRYDVNVCKRERMALFWEEKKPTEVRRCSWFYKGPLDSRYTPYEEDFAAKLEEEYRSCMEANKWNRKIEHNGETVVLHGPVVMVHYSPTGSSDQLGVGVATDTSPVKPRVVKRGVEEFEIEEGEPNKVDHLLFLVHGIGSVCDLRFRDVVETVDDFRSLALQLTRTHFSLGVEKNQVNRVEVLPVSWHWKLHGEDTGIDRKLNSITLKSIPRLRNFTNDTLLDILFYTSPVYCQTIMDTVGNEMNRMYELFLKRNPDFQGSVSVGGHSLGSLILFDLLYHQKVPKIPRSSPSIVMTGPGIRPPDTSPSSEKQPEKAVMQEDGEEPMEEDDVLSDESMALAFSRSSSLNRRASRVNYMIGTAGTGQPHISYPQLNFKPENFFALGSPIGMFVTVRGIETLGDNFRLPTCPGFFNIFHPFDPVAYRIESLIDPDIAPTLKPVIIPHHKGRKRMHLELKETMARMGSDLKNKLVDSVKNTWNTMTQYSMFSRPEPPTMETEVTKALEAHLGPATLSAPLDIGADTELEGGDDADVTLGCLNRGRRVDYVLQEAPLESFNEYLFALQSHVCYWESEDTLLMILTEIYSWNGVKPDSVLTGVERERSPMKILSDQLLASASPPKFSALRFPSSTSLSSEGSTSSQGVSRSQSVPKTLNDPNSAMLSTSSPGYLESLGQPPQLGMDPTAPISEVRNLAPPPVAGFVKQSLQRK